MIYYRLDTQLVLGQPKTVLVADPAGNLVYRVDAEAALAAQPAADPTLLPADVQEKLAKLARLEADLAK